MMWYKWGQQSMSPGRECDMITEKMFLKQEKRIIVKVMSCNA